MSNQPNRRFRVLGLLPLIFFLTQTVHYWHGGLGNLLWMCNIGNLLLAIGLFLDHRELIRAAAIWTIPGLVVWFRYVLLDYGFLFSSTLAHVGGIVIALIALRRVGMDRTAWLYAFVWYLFVQLAARLLTSPALNVNLAYSVQPGWEKVFSSYWKFWIVLTTIVAVGLWGLGMILLWMWPAASNQLRQQAVQID